MLAHSWFQKEDLHVSRISKLTFNPLTCIIESVLDEDYIRQLLSDTRIMLYMIKPARDVQVFLLFLNCKVSLSDRRKRLM